MTLLYLLSFVGILVQVVFITLAIGTLFLTANIFA